MQFGIISFNYCRVECTDRKYFPVWLSTNSLIFSDAFRLFSNCKKWNSRKIKAGQIFFKIKLFLTICFKTKIQAWRLLFCKTWFVKLDIRAIASSQKITVHSINLIVISAVSTLQRLVIVINKCLKLTKILRLFIHLFTSFIHILIKYQFSLINCK